MHISQKTIAIGTGSLIIFIWSGWITISRMGVQSHLTPADITLLRYTTAAVCAIPFLFAFTFDKSKLLPAIPMALGVGFPYTILSFYALRHTQAANAGVLVNGLLPVFTAFFSFMLFKEKIILRKTIAIIGIFIANILMITGGSHDIFSITWLMLIGAAIIYTIHIISVRAFHFHFKEMLILIPIINVVLFVPLFFLFESNLTTAPFSEIITQSVYQGIVVNMIGLLCGAYTIKHLGATVASLFYSFVPSMTAIVAYLLLGESLTLQEIVSIVLCSGFLVLYNYRKRGL